MLRNPQVGDVVWHVPIALGRGFTVFRPVKGRVVGPAYCEGVTGLFLAELEVLDEIPEPGARPLWMRVGTRYSAPLMDCYGTEDAAMAAHRRELARA